MNRSRVSAKTGLAISTVSKLEKGLVSLTYDKLARLSRALEVEMSGLFPSSGEKTSGRAAPNGRRVVDRAGGGQMIQTLCYRQTNLATELLYKRILPLMLEVKACRLDEVTEEFGALFRHSGEVFAVVLEGEAEFHSEVYAPLRLKTGDSVYFDSAIGYAFLNVSDQTCRIMCAGVGMDCSVA